MKAFAAEVLSATTVLALFSAVVLKPMAVMVDHRLCLDLLSQMLWLFQTIEDVPANLARLRSIIQQHHVLFKTLYPQCVKPKCHYVFHVPDCMERFGCLLNCFSTERKHRGAKNIASFCHDKTCQEIRQPPCKTRPLYLAFDSRLLFIVV